MLMSWLVLVVRGKEISVAKTSRTEQSVGCSIVSQGENVGMRTT